MKDILMNHIKMLPQQIRRLVGCKGDQYFWIIDY